MKRSVWLILILLVLVGCGSNGNGVQGSIVYQSVDESGKRQPELVMIDAQGEEQHRVSISGSVVNFYRARTEDRILVTTLDPKQYLVDVEQGTVHTLDLPEDVSVGGGNVVGGGERWLLAMGFDEGSVAHLVNLETGEVNPLTEVSKEATRIIYGEFAANEAHLALWLLGSAGDEVWLVPTENPNGARRLGSGRPVQWGGFSSDGKQIVYLERTEAKERDIFVEGVDGSGQEVVVSGTSAARAVFVPQKEQLLLAGRERLSVHSLKSGQEQELLTYSGVPLALMFAPSGKKVVLGVDTRVFSEDGSGGREWTLVDLEERSAESLKGLFDLLPGGQTLGRRWLFFIQNVGPLEGGERFVGLDLESGETRLAMVLDGATRFFGPMGLSPDGKFGLIVAKPEDGKFQLWLLHAESGEARLLDEADLIGGSFSPDGQWVAVGSVEREGDQEAAHVRLMATEGEEVKELVEGLHPVWVQP
jgi:hypothetical protein